MRAKLVLALMLAIMSVGAAPKPLAPLGVGVGTCRSWLSHHEAKDRQAEVQNEWLAGFITGYSTFSDSRRRATSFFRFDLATLPSGITAQCRANPRLDIYSATNAFLDAEGKLRITVTVHLIDGSSALPIYRSSRAGSLSV